MGGRWGQRGQEAGGAAGLAHLPHGAIDHAHAARIADEVALTTRLGSRSTRRGHLHVDRGDSP